MMIYVTRLMIGRFFLGDDGDIYDERSMLYDENWPILFDDLPLFLWLMNRYRW